MTAQKGAKDMGRAIFLFASLLLAGGPDPVSEARDATDHAKTLGKDAQYTRYLSTYNLAEEESKSLKKTMRFWLNSLTYHSRFTFPLTVTDTLFFFDIRDYGWTKEVWEEAAKHDPYFGIFDGGCFTETGSHIPVMRADFFLAITSIEPFYSKFLGLPNELEKLKKTIYIQEEGVRALSLNKGGSVLKSIVALHNRQLERWPTITGYFWLSRDVLTEKDEKGRKNVLEANNLFEIDFDGGEFIWSLPNGLQGYYLSNKQGKQLKVVPADIAQDTKSPFKDKQVRSGRNCVVCHAQGINSFDDVISRMIKSNRIDLLSYDREKARAIEEFYLSELGERIKLDQATYVSAVRQATGRAAEENATAYASSIFDYVDEEVTVDVALLELGVTEEWLEKTAAITHSGTLAAMLEGIPVSRNAWEEYYPVALRVKYNVKEGGTQKVLTKEEAISNAKEGKK